MSHIKYKETVSTRENNEKLILEFYANCVQSRHDARTGRFLEFTSL